ncbi:hypothetical protein [Agromyces soli]|uniref:SAF domain-containing protein n=1 Tax=Agromyces soli TaxID=659012 RepID=A0ABY4AS47_9MICO|nr:hypothetical protein [Agromyces soli]UOE25982.1 hypothetical protein MTP13_16985 [Agromyces soli]
MVGLLLVVASVVGVWALVGGLDRSVRVYAARDTITAGSRLEARDLETVWVVLGDRAARYLSAESALRPGTMLARTVGPGELLPRDAVADASDGTFATVVVPSRGPLPEVVAPGSSVDVWAGDAVERGFEPPAVLVPAAEVVSLRPADSPGADGPLVELRLDRERLPLLLEAIASGDAIDLVPARSVG